MGFLQGDGGLLFEEGDYFAASVWHTRRYARVVRYAVIRRLRNSSMIAIIDPGTLHSLRFSDRDCMPEERECRVQIWQGHPSALRLGYTMEVKEDVKQLKQASSQRSFHRRIIYNIAL